MKKILLCFTLASALLSSCATEPTACFSVNKDNVKENEEVQFNAACSEEATAYSWNFGDGATASGIEAKHKYSTAGTYTAELSAATNGVSDVAPTKITVVK